MGEKISYEAIALGAYLPYHTVAFTFPNSGIPFQGGVFRIEYVRPETEADKANFKSPPINRCVMCGKDDA